MAQFRRMQYSVPNSSGKRMKLIEPGRTIREVIELVARAAGADVDAVSLDGCTLDRNDPFDGYYEAKDQLFVFSKAAVAAAAAPSQSHSSPPPAPTPPRPSIYQAVDWIGSGADRQCNRYCHWGAGM
jgi:hypothetical protein